MRPSVPRRRPGSRFRKVWAPAFAGALAISTTSPASAAIQPGAYDGSQTELATALELRPDGRFRYALSYGALDERAEGRWEEKTGTLLLTTEPAPKPPRFPVVSDRPSPDGKLYASLENADALGGFSLTLRVRYDGAEAFDYLEAGEDGLVPVPAGKAVAEIVPDLPVYGTVADTHRLTPGGHRVVFRFEANDLGVADFRAESLAVEGGAFVLRRHDRIIRFRKTP